MAVGSLSLSLLAVAVALPLFARLVDGRAALSVSLVPAFGAALAALGNLLEDGAGLDWAADWLYLPSVALFAVGLAGLTVTLAVVARGRARLLAAVPAWTLVGIVLLEAGGGVLVLAVWLVAAWVSIASRGRGP